VGEDPFAGFDRFGDYILNSLDGGDRSAQKFKYLLGLINVTLITTHGMVISRLAALRQATTAEEAKVLLKKLREKELTEAFRVEGLCDALFGLGEGLLNRTGAARGEGSLSSDELTDARSFARKLYDREAEVARLYSSVLTDVTDQVGIVNKSSLPELQRRAREIEALLTDHVSEFSAKADRFTRVSA
jgi:hypothetical protein